MSGDPGGFPAVSSGRDGPDAGDDLSYYYGGPPGLDDVDVHGPRTTRALDPWGEHGPRDQAEADTPLSPAQRVRLLSFPTYGDPSIAPIEFADAYSRLAATTAAQLAFVDELIRGQVAEHGVDALVLKEMESVVLGKGDGAWAELQPTGKESLAALVTWQTSLRRDLASLLKDGIKLAVKAKEADALRRYGSWIAATLENFSGEIGIEWDQPETRRAAQRAVLATRQQFAIGATSPNAVGARLTEEEQAAIRSR